MTPNPERNAILAAMDGLVVPKNIHENIHESAVIGGPAQWRGHETKYEVIIDATATVGPLTQIDAGCERETIVGAGTQVMGHVHIGHGVQIGDDCDIASGTVIAGEVTIGNSVRIGVGALLKPYITIGDGARIGMGAVVINDVPAGEVWVGNPAKKLEKKPVEVEFQNGYPVSA